MATFSTDMLDGLELLYKRTDGVLKSCQETVKLISEISKLEKEYAKKLQKLASSQKKEYKKTNPVSSEVGSTFRAWDQILTELEKVSEHHNNFGEKLEQEIAKPIGNYVKEKAKVKKKLESDGKKLTSDWKAVCDNLDKTRNKYVSLSKASDAAALEHEQGKGNMSMKPNQLAKLASKASQAQEKAAAANSDYQAVLATTNQKQTEYYTVTQPALLMEFQQFEEDRLRFMKEMAEKFSAFNAEKPQMYSETSEAISMATQSISVEEDIQAYLSENKTGVAPPSDIQYVPYNSEAPPPATKGAPPKPKVKGKIGKYKPAAGPDVHKQWGLTSADQGTSLEQQQAKLNGQMDEIDKLLTSETKSKEGLESLVKFYASDPVAQKKAEDELNEVVEKINVLHDAKNIVQSQLTSLQNGGFDYSSYSGGQGKELRVRGLYDYEATCETELGFREGDIMIVTEQDDSGWWYCELNGVSGFVPNNYVEIIN